MSKQMLIVRNYLIKSTSINEIVDGTAVIYPNSFEHTTKQENNYGDFSIKLQLELLV